jgi:signal transduction histidine kinase
MSVAKTGETLPGEEGTFSGKNGFLDMGLDLLTPTSSIIAYTDILIEYANTHLDCQDLIPDFDKMLAAGEQLSNLITQLFSNKNSHGQIDPEALTPNTRHDLRTPINAIIGYGEMSLEELEEKPDPHPEAIRDLNKNCRLSKTIVEFNR